MPFPKFPAGQDLGIEFTATERSALQGLAANAVPINALVSGAGVVAGSTDPASASANTAAIRAALAGGAAYVVGGTVYINDTLAISRDDTSLVTGPGTVIKMVPGTDKCMVQTAAATAAGASVTVAWSAGMVASLAWAGHPLAVGDGVVLQGAAEGVWRQMLRVVSVTDAGNVVVALRKRVTAGPTGTLTAWRCLRNVRIDASLDYSWQGATTATALDRMTTALYALADFDIKVRAKSAYKYGLLLCGVIDGTWDAISTDVSDLAKVYGPATGVKGKVRGVSRDDQFSYQAMEPSAFIAYQRFVGPIYDCDTDSATNTQTTGASNSAMVLYTDTTHKSDGIVFTGAAVSQLRGGVNIKPGDDWIGSEASCYAGRVELRGVTLAPKPANYAVNSSVQIDELIIERPRIEPGDGVTQLMRQESTGTIKLWRITDWVFRDTSWPAGATQFAVNVNGSTDSFEIEGGAFSGNASYFRGVNVGTGGTVRKVLIRGGTWDSGNCVVMVPASVASNPTIIFDGCTIRNFTNVLVALSACTVVFRNCDLDAITYVVKGQTNPINIKVVDGGGNKFTSAPLAQMLNSSTLTIYGQELPVTLSTTGVQATVRGQFCTSATAVGTIPAGAPVVCDGTKWRAVEDRTLLYP